MQMGYSIGRRKLSCRQNNLKLSGEGLASYRLQASYTYKQNALFHKIYLKLRASYT
jgi:hypothetical protein